MRIDEENMRQYRQEYSQGPIMPFGKVVLTEHWLFKRSVFGDRLLPLTEAVRIDLYGAPKREQTYFNGDMIITTTIPASYAIKVRFSNGTVITIPCAQAPDRAMGEFARRCPQAKFGHHAYRENLFNKKGVYPWISSP